MITQIIINEDKDLHISNNYGDVEPFNSALKIQMFYPVYQAINGLDNQLISRRLLRNHTSRRLLRNHTRKYWHNLPYNKTNIKWVVNEYLFSIFNKPKNIF